MLECNITKGSFSDIEIHLVFKHIDIGKTLFEFNMTHVCTSACIIYLKIMFILIIPGANFVHTFSRNIFSYIV